MAIKCGEVVMSDLTIEVDIKKLQRTFALIPKELKAELCDAFDHITLKFLKQFKQSRLQGRPGVRGAQGPGNLFTRFKRASLVSQNLDGMGMTIFTDSKIAKLQEEGGIVKDSTGGKLAVPLSARSEMFTSTGKLRQSYKQPGLVKNIILLKLAGKTFLAKVFKKSRQIKPLYVLKGQVRIPARLGFYQTWDEMKNERIFLINKAVDKALTNTT